MAATYSKPAKVPRWADDGLNVTEPGESQKDSGWLFEQQPPSSYENWKENLNGSWWKWINERLFDGSDANTFVVKDPAAGAALLSLTTNSIAFLAQTSFKLSMVSSNPVVTFDASNDELEYDRAGNAYNFKIAGTTEASISAAGLNVTNGLNVGFATAPTDDALFVGDANFGLNFNSGTAPRITFDSGDLIKYTRSTNLYEFQIGSATEMQLDGSGLAITNGLNVGFTSAPTDDTLSVGDTDYRMQYLSATDVRIVFDNARDDYFKFTRNATAGSRKLELFINAGTAEVIFDNTGVRIDNGLNVGFVTQPTDDAVFVGDGVFGLQLSGGVATSWVDTTDYSNYTRSSNTWAWVVASTTEMTLNSTELNLTSGHIKSNGSVTITTTTGSVNLVSTSDSSFLTLDNDLQVALGANGQFTLSGNIASQPLITFTHSGNNANRAGIRLTCGANDGSGTTDYLDAEDGDGTDVGAIRNTSGTFALLDLSDPRAKEDIAATKIQALDLLGNLELIEYTFKRSGESQPIGFNAENCAKHFPEMVSVLKGGMRATNRAALIPVLVKGVQELLARIESLEQK